MRCSISIESAAARSHAGASLGRHYTKDGQELRSPDVQVTLWRIFLLNEPELYHKVLYETALATRSPMTQDLIATPSSPLASLPKAMVPSLFADAGEDVARRYIEFFTAELRNSNTRTPTLKRSDSLPHGSRGMAYSLAT